MHRELGSGLMLAAIAIASAACATQKPRPRQPVEEVAIGVTPSYGALPDPRAAHPASAAAAPRKSSLDPTSTSVYEVNNPPRGKSSFDSYAVQGGPKSGRIR